MKCRKAFDLDLVACLLDAGRPEWSEFREHYPRCPDCAAEVRTWTELQSSLAPPHPTAQDLARFEARGNDLAPDDRSAIAAHIATCRSCRDELRALRAFDPRQLAGPDATSAQRTARRRWWSPVRLVLHPAFAYGVVLALLYPTLAPRLRPLALRALEELAGTTVPAAPAEHRLARAPSVDAVAGAPAETKQEEPPVARTARALPAGREIASSPNEWPEVVLTPDREVILPAPERGIVLRLAPPHSQPALPAGLAWLRVRDAAGRRELREQQFGMPGSTTEMHVPAAWLEPGGYRADIVLGDDNRPLVVARFRVEP